MDMDLGERYWLVQFLFCESPYWPSYVLYDSDRLFWMYITNVLNRVACIGRTWSHSKITAHWVIICTGTEGIKIDAFGTNHLTSYFKSPDNHTERRERSGCYWVLLSTSYHPSRNQSTQPLSQQNLVQTSFQMQLSGSDENVGLPKSLALLECTEK
jgi:hypothetical protein